MCYKVLTRPRVLTSKLFKGMNPMRSLLRSLAAVSLLSVAPAFAQDRSSCEAGEQELIFSMVSPLERHPKGEAAQAFASEINRKFNGRFCVVIYAGAKLYDDDENLFNAMLAGEVTFAAPSLVKIEDFSQKLLVFNMPFLFDSPLHALEFMNSDLADEITKDFEDDGFYAFGFWSNGMRQMISANPLRNYRDGEGLTFRVESLSPITLAIFEIMGIDVVKLPFSKVNEALETNEVQGLENPWSNIELRRFYTYNNYIIETNHNYLGYMVMTTTSFMDSLSDEDRQTFIDTMKLVTHERNRFAYEMNQQSRANVIEDGGSVVVLTEEEVQAYRDTFRPIIEEYRGAIGSAFLDQVIEINANARPFD